MVFQLLPYTELPYPIETNGVYHSSFRRAASERLGNTVSGPAASALQRALSVPNSKRAWAIVIENDGQPMYVVQNMKHSFQAEDQRRVLRVCLPLAAAYLAPST